MKINHKMSHMKKLLFAALLIPLGLLSCKHNEVDGGVGKGTSILIQSTTDEGVIIRETRAQNLNDYWLSVSGPEEYSLERLLGSERTITGIDPGSYTVTLTSMKEEDFNLPALNRPIYRGTATETVVSNISTKFTIVARQMNVGVKFVFDESVVEHYADPKGTVAHSINAAKTMTLGPADEGVNTAYFEAPNTLRVTFTDGGTPVKIGGKEYVDINASPRELWTITFKTSSRAPGDLELEVSVDEDTDPQNPDFGVGDVDAEGSVDSPFSVADAINSMPANYVWVQGVIVGTASLTRNGDYEQGNILIGKELTDAPGKCIMIQLPAGSAMRADLNLVDNPKNLGMRIAIRGDVGAVSAGYTAFAELKNPYGYSLNYFIGMDPINYHFNDKVLKTSVSFPVGSAVGHESLQDDPTYVQILKREFNSVTSEYNMKMGTIWKGGRGSYDFSGADIIVNFAHDNGMRVHGHTLAWSQEDEIPMWLQNLDLEPGDPEWTVLLKEYITTVVTHFKGRVDSWDVVNEAFRDYNGEYRGSDPWDTSTIFWYKKIGEDFVKIAFEAARAADPDCKLFYNDYGFVNPAKRAGMIPNLKKLIDDGVPIDGIGMQLHVEVHTDAGEVTQAFRDVLGLGEHILVHASEIDVIVNTPGFIESARVGYGNGPLIAGDHITRSEMYYGLDGHNNYDLQYAQGKTYNVVVNAFMKEVPDNRKYGLTTWGFTDRKYNALNHYNQFTDYPMMFGSYYNRKRAYDAVLEGLNGVDWEEMEKGYYGWRWEQPGGFEPNAPWE